MTKLLLDKELLLVYIEMYGYNKCFFFVTWIQFQKTMITLVLSLASGKQKICTTIKYRKNEPVINHSRKPKKRKSKMLQTQFD